MTKTATFEEWKLIAEKTCSASAAIHDIISVSSSHVTKRDLDAVIKASRAISVFKSNAEAAACKQFPERSREIDDLFYPVKKVNP